MSKLVLLNLGRGSLQLGFPAVTVQLQSEEQSQGLQLMGILPPAPELFTLYQRWQLLYGLLYRARSVLLRQFQDPPIEKAEVRSQDNTVRLTKLSVETSKGSRGSRGAGEEKNKADPNSIGSQESGNPLLNQQGMGGLETPTDWQDSHDSGESDPINSEFLDDDIIIEDAAVTHVSEAEFAAICGELQRHIDAWLESEGFRPIERQLRMRLSPDDEIRVIIQTEDSSTRKLPWCIWQFFRDYPRAEVALSALNFAPRTKSGRTSDRVRILAILGRSAGIDVESDRQLLENLAATQVVFLVEPQRREFNEQLWERQGWDILFFAGHSSVQDSERMGQIYINPTESLTIPQLHHALTRAIERGLQLAIFNSCEGLGLASQLADLNIPQTIVMREPVPDLVAQEFLKYFLIAFLEGQSLYLAVREARERLQGLEGEFPGASWLPVLFQNPAATPPRWQDLIKASSPPPLSRQAVTMVFTDLVSSTEIKNHLPGRDLNARDLSYFEKILKPHRQRVETNLAAAGGRVVKTEGDAYFLVFLNASQAARWAVTLQASHLSDPIETPLGPLQVRIGMHTGSPISDNEDFIGQDVDYAARITEIASGGQVLLSEVTEVLVRSTHLADLTLHYLGSRSLKGIGEVPIYELRSRNPIVQTRKSASRGIAPESLEAAAPTEFVPQPRRWSVKIGPTWRHLYPLVQATVLATTLVMGVRWLGFLQPLELSAFDTLMRLRPAEKVDERLTLVTIDAADKIYQEQAGMPMLGSLADLALVRLLEKLKPHQPAVIGLDIYRDYRQIQIVDRQSNALATRLRDESFIDICQIGGGANNPDEILPPPQVPLENVGFSDLALDPDLVVRRQILGMAPGDQCDTKLSFSFLIAQRYLTAQGIEFKRLSPNQFQIGARIFPKVNPHSGGYHRLDAGGFEVLLNYRAAHPLARQISLRELLSGSRDAELASLVRDRIVLIGNVDKGDKDFHQTPYSSATWTRAKMSGVEIQAHMVSHLVSAVLAQRPVLWWWPQWADLLWVWGWSVVVGVVVWSWRSRHWYRLLASGMAIAILAGVCFVFLWLWGGWLPLIPSVLAMGVVSLVINFPKKT